MNNPFNGNTHFHASELWILFTEETAWRGNALQWEEILVDPALNSPRGVQFCFSWTCLWIKGFTGLVCCLVKSICRIFPIQSSGHHLDFFRVRDTTTSTSSSPLSSSAKTSSLSDTLIVSLAYVTITLTSSKWWWVMDMINVVFISQQIFQRGSHRFFTLGLPLREP